MALPVKRRPAPGPRGLALSLASSALLCLATSAGAQEHSYAPADIQAGMGVYQANCLGCHGDKGDAVEGANLATGRFRHASTDEDLVRLIRGGIPNTLMPPHDRLSVAEVRTVVAFVRSLTAGGGVQTDNRDVAIGNPQRGRELFFNGSDCSSCHAVNGEGSRLGPDLAGIGAQRSPGALEDSLLLPDAEVLQGNRFYRVVDAEGRASVGRLLNQDTHSVQLMNEAEQLVSFQKDKLSEHGFVGSPMPSYQDVLSTEQVADLLGYLLSLNGDSAP